MTTAIVGIDVGSHSCYVSVAKKGGVETVLNEQSDRRTPSCVAFTNKTRFCGSSGMTQLVTNPKNTVYNFVTFIGKKYSDNTVQTELPYTHYKLYDDTESISIEVRYLNKDYRFKPEQILAMLITKLKHMAENDLLLPVTQAVVNVPMAYTDVERRCILTALNIAGIECICLLNDLTSVAILYHSTRVQTINQSKVIAFIDIGYSNFQIALTRFDKDKIQVLHSFFDNCLGGREFDRVIFNYLSKQFSEKYNLDVMDSAKGGLRLMVECEKIKKRLSANAAEFDVNIDCLMNDKDVTAKIDRKLFENLSNALLKRMNAIIVNIIQLYRKNCKDPISSVEIVGGTSRIPCVRQVIMDAFKLEPQNTLNADEAVSRGCAIQSAMMNSNCMIRRINFLDCVPYGITLDTFTGISLEVLLKFDAEKKNSIRQQSVPIISTNQSYPLMSSVELLFNECSIIEIKYNDRNEVPNDNKIIGYIKINHESGSSEKLCKILLEYSLNIHGVFVINSLLLTRNSKSPKFSNQSVPMAESSAINSSKTDYSKKKGKTHKSSPVNYDVYGPIDFEVFYKMSYDSQILSKFRKQELDFIAIDHNETERLDMKNRLEETIYHCRDFLNNSETSAIIQNDNDNFIKTINELENWLLEEGGDENKEKYEECLFKLDSLIKSNKIKRDGNKNKSNIFEELQNTIMEAEDILINVSRLLNDNNNEDSSNRSYVEKLKLIICESKQCLMESNGSVSKEEDVNNRIKDLRGLINSMRELSQQ